MKYVHEFLKGRQGLRYITYNTRGKQVKNTAALQGMLIGNVINRNLIPQI